MAEVSGGARLSAKMREIRQMIERGAQVRVGFIEGATYPDGTPVALVAAIQNFGAPAAGIPPRPFFSNMIDAESPRWGEQFKVLLRGAGYDAGKSLEMMGSGIAGKLRESIITTNSPPLKPETVKRKGGTATSAKPLVATGHMLASVEFELDEQVYTYSREERGFVYSRSLS